MTFDMDYLLVNDLLDHLLEFWQIYVDVVLDLEMLGVFGRVDLQAMNLENYLGELVMIEIVLVYELLRVDSASLERRALWERSLHLQLKCLNLKTRAD